MDSLFINTPKKVIKWSGLNHKANHFGHLVGVAELVDDQGITIPGHTLQIEIKSPVDVERCLFLFSIMRLKHKKREVVYQLEVAPATKKTHNGTHPIYGPHEHTDPTKEPTPVTASVVDCSNWDGCLLWFFNRTSIIPFRIDDPRHVHL